MKGLKMYTPIIIPIPTNTSDDESKCPQCKKDEDVIRVCKNCRYEYPEENLGPIPWAGLFFWLFMLILFVNFMCVFGYWIFQDKTGNSDYDRDTPETLSEVLHSNRNFWLGWTDGITRLKIK
jgi:rubredoxin